MRPDAPLSPRSGSGSGTGRTTPVRLIARTRSQMASDVSWAGEKSSFTPAMFARPSMRDPAVPTIRSMSACWVMSPATTTTSGVRERRGEVVQAVTGDVDGDHASAFAGYAGGRGPSDARCGASDDHCPAVESARGDALMQHHGLFGVLRWCHSGVRLRYKIINHALGQLAPAQRDQLLQRQVSYGSERALVEPAPFQQVPNERAALWVLQPGPDCAARGQWR